MGETSRVLSSSTESALGLAILATVAHLQTPTITTLTRPEASSLSITRTQATKDLATRAIVTIKAMATTKAMVTTKTKATIIRATTTKATATKAQITKALKVGGKHHHGKITATNRKQQIPMDRIRTTDINSRLSPTDKVGTTITKSRSRAMASRAGATTTTKSLSKPMDKAGTPAISSNNPNNRMASRIGTSKDTAASSSSLRTTIGIKGIASQSSSISRKSRILCRTLAASAKLTSPKSTIHLGAKAKLFLQRMKLKAGTMSVRSTQNMNPGASSKVIPINSLNKTLGAKVGTTMIR